MFHKSRIEAWLQAVRRRFKHYLYCGRSETLGCNSDRTMFERCRSENRETIARVRTLYLPV